MSDKVLLVFIVLACLLLLLALRLRGKPAVSGPKTEGPFDCPRCKGKTRIDKPDGKGSDWCPVCRGCGQVTGKYVTYDRYEECKKCHATGFLRPPTNAFPDGSASPGATVEETACADCTGGLVKTENHKVLCYVRPYAAPATEASGPPG